MKQFKVFVKKYFLPNDIYEANYVLLFTLQVIRALPITFNTKSVHNKISVSTLQVYISRLVCFLYCALIYDQLYYRVSTQVLKYVLKTILKADVIASFIASLVTLITVHHFGPKCVIAIEKIFIVINEIDSQLPDKETKKYYRFFSKLHLCAISSTLSIFIGIAVYFSVLNFETTGWRGVVRCMMYFYPFTGAYALIYCYMCLVMILRQRFNYIYNSLYEKYLILNTPSKTNQEQSKKFHDKE